MKKHLLEMNPAEKVITGSFVNHERRRRKIHGKNCLCFILRHLLMLIIVILYYFNAHISLLNAKEPYHRMDNWVQDPVNSIAMDAFPVCFITANEDCLHGMNSWNLSLLIHH